ncbi:helix-turn-helix domain-containing protein [Pontibacter virosus]|uniref:Excisionase family DNA binding protein n=1 Tax=Pontibacter virosus TaxID=1765052 RepID=A0A2U1B3K7_9BACT|nr:helix-turn-helix domain-containing protein [Pontibacter virosus]PVY43253.1 excisionase family DNA binding protein [Pontibacter virosus]
MAVKVIEEHEYLKLLERLEKLEQKVASLEKTAVQWLTTDQACQQLQCGREKLDSLRKSGKIEYRKIGATYRYLASSIADCYEETIKAKSGRGKKLPKLANQSKKRLS